MLNLHSGLPYSLIKHGLPFNYPALGKNIRTDVIIAGGGISGALTAYALAQAGIGAIVVDSRTIATGSTAASTSLIQYEIDTPLVELAGKIGIVKAEAAYRLSYQALTALQAVCNRLHFDWFEPKTSLYLASRQKDVLLLEKEYAARKALGFEVDLWDARLIQQRMGFDAPLAIYSGAAAQTDAYRLTHVLHQHNKNKGVEVFDRTEVLRVSRTRQSVKVHTAGGHTITAGYLVVATGYEAMQYIKEPLVKLHSTYALASENRPGNHQWYKNCLLWETKNPYLYMRTTADNRIVIGGRDEVFYNPARRDRLIQKKTALLVKDFGKKFPHIPLVPEFTWTGTFAITEDGLPFIGAYPRLPRTFFALGFGGNGITFSQLAADIITDLITGKKKEAPDLFAFGRKPGR